MQRYRCRSAFGAREIGAIAFLALSILTAKAVAQDAPPATLRVATRLTAQAPLDENYWAASLDRAIAHSARVIEVQRAAASPAATEGNGYLITVEAAAEVVEDGVKTVWRLIDPVDGSTFAEGVEEGSLPSRRILDEIYWLGLVEALERWDTLIIEAEPGTRIEGIGKEAIVMDGAGTVKVLVEQPKIYRWRAVRAGMADRSGILSLPNDNVPLKITFHPLYRWAVEAAVRLAFFPELRLYHSLVEDKLFARFGFAQSFWAFRFAAEEDELFSSAYGGRFEPSLGCGFYFRGQDNKIRPYFVMDLAMRLIHTNEAFLYFDLPDAFRLTPSLGMNVAFTARTSGFLEAGVDLVGTFDDELGRFNGRVGTRIRF